MAFDQKKYALVLSNLDYILVDPSERKLKTYVEIGWDESSAQAYVSNPKNWDQIASFNTPTVTFSASSRRNRFYDIYWREDFFAYDKLYPHIIEILPRLIEKFNIIVFSDRMESMKEQTVNRLEEIGLPTSAIDILFKETHQTLTRFKQECISRTYEQFHQGLVVLHQPADIDLYRKYAFTPIGITTTNNRGEFSTADAVCQDWWQIVAVLNTVQ